MRYLFLDTNILLHFHFFTELPWTEVVGYGDFTIVIAPIVMDELDKHKNDSSKKISKKANAVISKLDEIIDGNSTAKVCTKIIDRHPSQSVFEKHNLTKDQADNILFASLIDFEIQAEDEKILITNDRGVRIRATPFQIKCFRVPEEFRMAEEQDANEAKLKALQIELDALKNKMPVVKVQFTNGLTHFEHEVKTVGERAEYIRRALLIIRRNHPPLLKESEKEKPLLSALMQPYFRISDMQIEAYNKDLEEFYAKYENYLVEKYDYDIYRSKCIAITFEITNTGTMPADDIDILLHFPDGFELVSKSKLKKAPEAPVAPHKPRSAFDVTWRNNHYDLSDRLGIANSGMPRGTSAPTLTKLEKTSSYEVEFKAKNLKHHKSEALPILYACFESVDDMNNFTIDYSLLISNLPDKSVGKLHVVIKRN